MSSMQTEDELTRLFLGQQRSNITFIVDVSESMRSVLGSVQRLLIRTLLIKASHRNSLFNISTLSSQLSRHMLPCSPSSVYTALPWIRSVTHRPGTGTDTHPHVCALTSVLCDPACHSVHLLLCAAAGPPHAEDELMDLSALTGERSVNVFYLQDSHTVRTDGKAEDYLQGLTRATGGRCYEIQVGLNGELEKVVPLCAVEDQSSPPTSCPVKCCCPSTSGLTSNNALSPLLRCSLGNLQRRVSSCVLSAAPDFSPGCRVLARKEMDGFYYSGTVMQQVQGCGGVWVVDFDRPDRGAVFGITSSHRQLVCSPDMLSLTEAHPRCLGDAVLSPWEPDVRRYGPGRVMGREGLGVDGVRSLRVLMWNGCVSLVPGNLVFPISTSQHDRIVRELRISTSVPRRCRSGLCSRSFSYSPSLSCCCSPLTNHQPFTLPHSLGSDLRSTDDLETAKQRKQVEVNDADAKTSDRKVQSSSSSSSLSSSTSSSVSEDEVTAAKLVVNKQRPPWRYWRRTGPEPQHTQPGIPVPRKTSQLTFSFPVPRFSTSPNHSSLFQSLPGSKGRRLNVGDVLGAAIFKPRPPDRLKPSGNNTTAVYT